MGSGINKKVKAGDTKDKPKDINTIFSANSQGDLRFSRDKGKTWKKIGNIKGRLEGKIAIESENPNLILIGANEKVWRSDDGGINWCEINEPRSRVMGFHFDLTGPPNKPGICFTATPRGVWRSDDGGLTWVKKSVTQYRYVPTTDAQPETVYTFDRSTVYRSDNAGKSWRVVFYPQP